MLDAARLTVARSAGSPMVQGRHTVSVMGTVVSFDLRDPVPSSALADAIRALQRADELFSTYKANSPISRLGRAEITFDQCPPDVVEVLNLCERATSWTDGYFDAYAAGRLDPSGLVKGWAIRQASDILSDAGSRHHSVNGGGDIQFAGGTDDGTPWQVGIADPHSPDQLLAVLEKVGGAIATSGSGERGPHISDPRTGQPATHFLSVTIVAESIVDADVIATAAFARGGSAVDWVCRLDGVEGLFLTTGLHLLATPGLPLVQPD